MSLALRLALLGALLGLLVLGYLLRSSLEITASADSVRGFVDQAGWWAPALFVVLFAFRSVLLLPSIVLLTAGGICFGIAGGTVLGGMGLTFSAFLKWAIAVLAGRDWFTARLPQRLRARLPILQRRGSAGLLALATAYPIGPAEMLHMTAILGGMPAVPMFAAIGGGSLVRAGSFSLFGDAIADGQNLAIALVAMTVLALAPLAVPRFRRVLRGDRVA